ncbi:MAG: FmdB family zinc ribbon protein [Candidatus Nanopelagicaceae bacterium]
MNYEYKCPSCSTTLSVERSIHAEASNPSCLPCGEVMNRVWSAPPVIFNGSGFYKTDQ